MKKDLAWAFNMLEVPFGEFDSVDESFKQLARKNHPDLGGSAEVMKDLNLAREILSDNKSSGTAVRWTREQWEQNRKEWQDRFDALITPIQGSLEGAAGGIRDYLSTILDRDIESKIEKKVNEHFGSLTAIFSTADKRTNVSLYISVGVSSFNSLALGGENVGASVMVHLDIYHESKKYKVSQTNWKYTDDHSEFLTPSKLLPKAKLLKVIENNRDKPIKKADFLSFLRSEFKASMDRDFAHLYTANGYRLTIYRTVFRKVPAWGINGIYKGSGGTRVISTIPSSMSESRETMDFLRAAVRLIEENRMDEVAELYRKHATSFSRL